MVTNLLNYHNKKAKKKIKKIIDTITVYIMLVKYAKYYDFTIPKGKVSKTISNIVTAASILTMCGLALSRISKFAAASAILTAGTATVVAAAEALAFAADIAAAYLSLLAARMDAHNKNNNKMKVRIYKIGTFKINPK